MSRFSSACVSAAALCTLSQLASGQTLGWLPMADLPPTAWELAGDQIPPAASNFLEWDPDGSGPLDSRLVALGVLNSTYPGGAYAMQFTQDGWAGLNSSIGYVSPSPAPLVACLYRSPLDEFPKLIWGASGGVVRRYDGSEWNAIANVQGLRGMCVGDLDGPDGPELESLFISGTPGVFQWDGMILRSLAGGASAARSAGMCVWDADGDGPQPPQLFAGTNRTTSSSLLAWSGSSWMTVRNFASTVWTVSTFDFDGSGPQGSDLVVSQQGGVYRWHQGNWSLVGGGTGSGMVVRLTTFDPDGQGPLEPWLVAAGEFTRIGGVDAHKIAAFYDGSWHTFPNYIASHAYSLSVAENLPYSNSPQLLVSCMTARPSVSRFGLCDSPAGITGNAPTRSRQPEGQSATFDVIPSGDELTFRWYKGEAALVDGATTHGSTISGVYGPRLTIANVRAQDIGQYHAKVFNPLGQARSRDVALTVGCTADFNLDSTVDVSDYLDFITTFATNDPDADFNADRTIDFFDYLDFVNQFASGC